MCTRRWYCKSSAVSSNSKEFHRNLEIPLQMTNLAVPWCMIKLLISRFWSLLDLLHRRSLQRPPKNFGAYHTITSMQLCIQRPKALPHTQLFWITETMLAAFPSITHIGKVNSARCLNHQTRTGLRCPSININAFATCHGRPDL